MGFSFLITRQKPKTQNTCTIMKDDKDPFGSWIRIGMLGLVGRGPETTLVRLGTSHALSDGACLADGCSHLGKGQKTEETSRCVRLRLAGRSAQLTVEHPPPCP